MMGVALRSVVGWRLQKTSSAGVVVTKAGLHLKRQSFETIKIRVGTEYGEFTSLPPIRPHPKFKILPRFEMANLWAFHYNFISPEPKCEPVKYFQDVLTKIYRLDQLLLSLHCPSL